MERGFRALSHLRAFSGMRVGPVGGYFGCHQITVCRRNVEKLSRDQIGQAVLDIREAWKREGLDVENLYTNDLELFPGMSKKWGLSFLINTQPAPTGLSAGSLAWAGPGADVEAVWAYHNGPQACRAVAVCTGVHP